MRADGGRSDELHCGSAIWLLARLFSVRSDGSCDYDPTNERIELRVRGCRFLEIR